MLNIDLLERQLDEVLENETSESLTTWIVDSRLKGRKKILIGSRAIAHHFDDFYRDPKDWDFAVPEGKNSKDGDFEYLLNPVIFNYCDNDVLSPNLLLTLKVSHLFWNLNWEKHIFDAIFLFEKGCEIDYKALRELREYWEKVLPETKRSVLEKNKEDFFTNAVNLSTDEHDKLHAILEETPAYTKLLKEGCDVELDSNKWYNMSEDEKDSVVFEETAVMAFERYKTTPYAVAFLKQLKNNIIKHFPEYIAIYAIENYKRLRKPKYNFKQKLENGTNTTN